MEATLREPDTHRDADLLALVSEMREEISQLRREVSELRLRSWLLEEPTRRCGQAEYEKLQEELDQANAEIRQLKADLFGRKSEKQSSTDRSNHLDDPQDQNSANKKKRGQQPDRPGPARRDYSHLPVREKFVDVPPEGCVCGRCGKPLADLGETEDSEQVEVEFIVYRRRIRRRRYRKTCSCPWSANSHRAEAAETDSQGPLWYQLVGPLAARKVSRRATDPAHDRATSFVRIISSQRERSPTD